MFDLFCYKVFILFIVNLLQLCFRHLIKLFSFSVFAYFLFSTTRKISVTPQVEFNS